MLFLLGSILQWTLGNNECKRSWTPDLQVSNGMFLLANYSVLLLGILLLFAKLCQETYWPSSVFSENSLQVKKKIIFIKCCPLIRTLELRRATYLSLGKSSVCCTCQSFFLCYFMAFHCYFTAFSLYFFL